MDPELALLKNCRRKATDLLPRAIALNLAPVVTRDAINARNKQIDLFPQRGLLGSVYSVNQRRSAQNVSDPRLYVNLNTPSSGLICGVQVWVIKQ